MKINPDLYHGHDQYTNFFEDWYFKIDDISSEYCTFKAIDKNGTSIIKDQFYCTMAC